MIYGLSQGTGIKGAETLLRVFGQSYVALKPFRHHYRLLAESKRSVMLIVSAA
jgi:hypothetical protein